MVEARIAALEAALRHARGIVASEIHDRHKYLVQWQTAEFTRPTLSVDEAARKEARMIAQIREREQWIESWDRALAGGTCDVACDNCRAEARRLQDPSIEVECRHGAAPSSAE